VAVTIQIQRSESGLGDAAFADLAEIPDDSPWQHVDDTAEPGHFYVYRARRFDDSTGLASPWTEITPAAMARALHPNCETAMNMTDTCDVLTGSDESLYWGLEPHEGLPVRPEWLLALVDAKVNRDHKRLFSRRKRGAHTLRRAVIAGQVVYTADFEVEVTPEATSQMLLTALAHSAETLSTPTRYKHSFKNGKTCYSGTFIHRFGTEYRVLAGAKIQKFSIAPDLDSEDVLTMTFTVMCTAVWIIKAADVPTVATILGLASAVEDTGENYGAHHAAVYLDDEIGEVRGQFTVAFERDMARYKVYDATRGARGHFSKSGDPSAQLTSFYGNDPSLARVYREFGHEEDPEAGFGLGSKVVTVPLRVLFSPPANAATFVNELEVLFPDADVTCNEAAGERNEVLQQMQATPLDKAGNAEGTDFVLRLTNSISGTALVAPNALIPPADLPLTEAFTLAYGQAQAGATTTSIAAGASAVQPHLARGNDAYNGRRMEFVTGTLRGESQIITDYVGSTGAFTTEAFSQAPATGDAFVVL